MHSKALHEQGLGNKAGENIYFSGDILFESGENVRPQRRDAAAGHLSWISSTFFFGGLPLFLFSVGLISGASLQGQQSEKQISAHTLNYTGLLPG